MSNLKKIRQKMGISQQEAAGWLGISRSLANHYERGSRSLPTHALLQLSRLEIMIMEFEKQIGNKNGSWDTNHGIENDSWDTNHGDTNHDDEPLPLHPRRAYEQDKTARLQQQLALAESRHATLQWQKLFIKYVIDNSIGQTNVKDSIVHQPLRDTLLRINEKEKRWLQMLHDHVSYKVSKFDESKQGLLRSKIMALEIKTGRYRH